MIQATPGRQGRFPGKSCFTFAPLGDSITEGVRSQQRGGYRPPLFRLALQNEKSLTFVGDSTPNGPSTVDNVTFPRANEGWGGYTIDQISGLVVNTMNENKPHIITLMVGTNDVNTGRGTGAPTRLGSLMDKIVATNPNLLLVVAQITPTRKTTVNTAAVTYNEALPRSPRPAPTRENTSFWWICGSRSPSTRTT